LSKVALIRAPQMHIHTAPIHIAYIISILRENGIDVKYADYLETPFYLFENAMKKICIEAPYVILNTETKRELTPVEIDMLIERLLLDQILNTRVFNNYLAKSRLFKFEEGIIQELAILTRKLLEDLISKARIDEADISIIIPPSINTIFTYGLIHLIREKDKDIPIILMDYYNYDPSTFYFATALTQRDFYNNDISDVIRLDPEFSLIRRFIRQNITAIVIGEGFDFIQNCLINKKVRENLSVYNKKQSPLIFFSKDSDLNKLPLPDFSDMTQIFNSVQIEFSRGCVYSCIFCERSTTCKGNMRFYNFNRFCEVFKHILSYKRWERIQVMDSHINSNERLVLEFLKFIQKEGNFKIFAQLRPKKHL